jgi:REP element-mobilizing transposase RayT
MVSVLQAKMVDGHNQTWRTPPRIPVWLRDEQAVIYFVTICVARRKRVLANEQAFNAFKVAMAKLKRWEVLAAILMPDHLHLIAAPTQDREAAVGNFSAAIKRWIREEMSKDSKLDWQWQAGCFDRLLRSEESLEEKWTYVEQNPVRERLVKRFEDWPYRFVFNEE